MNRDYLDSRGAPDRLAPICRLDPAQVPLPQTAKISPGTACHLECQLCPVGLGLIEPAGSFMSLSCFQTVIDKITPAVNRLQLFNFGEALLNPDILEMVRYAVRRGLEAEIHSSLSLQAEAGFWGALVESGLSALVVSLDGASQPTLGAYKRGASFSLVIKNIRSILAERRV